VHLGGFVESGAGAARPRAGRPLYTAEERARRDRSPWTVVQGVLAPLQFAVFLVSLALVVRYLATGEGLFAANLSVVIKTAVLYLIMTTGSVWEWEVFGQWLFAPAFFWEDVVSMGVIALHTAYLAAVFQGGVRPEALMWLALAAYAAYAVNAAQFVLKLRAARVQERSSARSDEAAPVLHSPTKLVQDGRGLVGASVPHSPTKLVQDGRGLAGASVPHSPTKLVQDGRGLAGQGHPA
jgi:3-vinyl bacteriochlorophyllide hydratase